MNRRTGRSRTDQFAPALFPFLAVLVCTMGALVLILVIVVSQASASAKQAVQKEEDALLEVSDFVIVASDEMIARRAQQQQAIDNRRSQLAAIENHISRLVEELKDLKKSHDVIEQQSSLTDESRAEQTQRIASLEGMIHDEQEKLKELESKAANSKPAFAILPYQGSRGTTRRPIYLECTAGGVVIQPEGVIISIDDLKPPYGPGNPLDASLRLIRSAYQRLDPAASSTISPYPLLLVRPDGIKAYVLGRSAMSGWDDQFGYELIDQVMPLAFPPSIPGLSRQLEENLVVARQRQIALIAAMPRRFQNENEWNAALDELDQATISEGNQSKARARSNPTDWSSIDNAVGNGSPSDDWKIIAELPNAKASGYSAGHASPSPSPSSMANDAGNQKTRTPNPLPTQHEMQQLRQASIDGAFQPHAPLVANNPPQAIDGWQVPVSPSDGSYDPSLISQDPVVDATTGQDSQLNATQHGPSSQPNSRTAPNTSMQAYGKGAVPPPTSMSMTSSANDPGFQNLNSTQAPSAEGQRVDMSPTVDLSPRVAKPRSSSETNKNTEPIAHTWSSKRRHTNGTMISRPISIVVMPDRWLILKDGGRHQVESVIPLSIGPSAAGRQLEKAVEGRVESWGVAVAGGYWQPKLVVEYGPQSETSLQRLQKILDGSGIQIDSQPLR